MNTEIPGLDELVEVITKASDGPFTIQAGTILDSKMEIVAEFCTREDAAAIEALLHLKGELLEILTTIQPLFRMLPVPTVEERGKMADALIKLKEKVVRWAPT